MSSGRFRVKDTSTPEPIMTDPMAEGEEPRSLGTFLPGYYYRLTAMNQMTVAKMESEDRIEWEEDILAAAKVAQRGVALSTAPSEVTGTIKVGETP